MITAVTKQCFKCGVCKPRSDFYAHLQMKDGHLNKCKDCTKKDNSQHRINNIVEIRQYDRRRNKLSHRKAQRRTYHDNVYDPVKITAATAVHNALRDKRLFRPTACEVCGKSEKLHGHHESYARQDWLKVKWVCVPCHAQIHAKARIV